MMRRYREAQKSTSEVSMNKLADADRRIIAAVDLHATISVPEIARRTLLQRHTVTYHLEKLLRDGVLNGM